MTRYCRSHRYNARGERLDPKGGYYLIPAERFAEVVARSQYNKAVLNEFEFVAERAKEPCCCGG
jgi:hypothetical protein